MVSDTIIGAEFEPRPPLRSMIHASPGAREMLRADTGRRFKIRSADSFGQRSSASVLVDRMYATRGYATTALSEHQFPSQITLTASEHEETIGTITVGFDSDSGLFVDQLFQDQTAALRLNGRRICEFTKLAMDSVVRSKRVLASLFHVAYIYAHRIMQLDDLLIEVNPRHVRYYHQMLGFTVLCEPRLNRRVNAPAVLMRLDFSHAHRQIERFAGRVESAATDRSLYPHFFAIPEEAGIVGRLAPMRREVSSNDASRTRRRLPVSAACAANY